MTREEAIEIVRNIYQTDAEKGALAVLIPELAESEDERIRKFLIDILSSGVWRTEWPFSPVDCVAYLEKQKEIPMPGSAELIEMWEQEKKMLEGKDFRGDAWRLAYNAFMDGFARGTCVNLEKQKEQSFTHHETNESLRDAVTHQMEDDGDVDDFVRRGIDDIALRYATLGAEWQKEQFEKNRLAACDAQTREEYERETDFVDKFIAENQRTPTFSDAINYGIAWQKEQKEPTEELVYRLNGLMQEYIEEGADEAEKEHRLECYRLFWDALEDEGFFKKEQQPEVKDPFDDEQFRRGYEAGKNDAMRMSEMVLYRQSWYMEGYHDREFNMEPKWTVKAEKGGPRYYENPNYGKPLEHMSDYKVGDKISWKGKVYTIDKVVCYDNRFEIIDRAKQDLLDKTNIADSPDEMAALYNFLFRCWQMGWLKKYETDKYNSD